LSVASEEHPDRIEIEVFREKKSKSGFILVVGEKQLEGEEMLADLYRHLTDLRLKRPDLQAAVVSNDEVAYCHIIDVYSECLRAGVEKVTFEATPNPE
jgi:hypothetical protein